MIVCDKCYQIRRWHKQVTNELNAAIIWGKNDVYGIYGYQGNLFTTLFSGVPEVAYNNALPCKSYFIGNELPKRRKVTNEQQ